MSITFSTLNKDAAIFKELVKGCGWWERFKNEKNLYIEIRKDNQVNVYFEGGSIARIHYCSRHRRLQVFTHYKYLGIPYSGKNYEECSSAIEAKFDSMLQLVRKYYSQKHSEHGITPKEKWSEKYIQANLILNSKDVHLDSEFAYKDGKNDIRIDMVNVIRGAVTFIELKRIGDGRMLKSTDENPEVVNQMNSYSDFIKKYKDDILDYYQRLYDIKKYLGLPVPVTRPTSVNTTPQLLIFDRWIKVHTARERHKKNMELILKRENISYNIISEL